MSADHLKTFVIATVIVAVISVALLYTFVPDWWCGAFVGGGADVGIAAGGGSHEHR